MKQEVVLTIAGSRGFTDKQFIYYHANQYIENVVTYEIAEPRIVIQSGMAAKSPDEVAVQYANLNDYELRKFPYIRGIGKRGGPLRNAEMAEKTDYALMFWDGQSKGTRHFIDCMLYRGKPFQVVIVKLPDPPKQGYFDDHVDLLVS